MAFVAAALVTIFRLGTRRNLVRWEFLIDAANTAMTALLALECADQHPAVLHALGYGCQVVVLFVILLIPQFTVTFLARQVCDIALRLRTSLQCKPEESGDHAVLVMRLPTPRTRTSPSQSATQACDADIPKQTLTH